MSTVEQVVDSLRRRKAELLKELEAINGALETFSKLAQKGSEADVKLKKKPAKGFLSDEARDKISNSMKQVWAERKAKKAS